MMGYYERTDRITYDRAEQAVKQFVRENGESVSLVSAKEVCMKMELEPNQHNQHRVYDALSRRFEESDWGGSTTKFKLEASQ